jgi:hypothetical protein
MPCGHHQTSDLGEGQSHRNMRALPPVRASRNSIEPKLGVPNKHHLSLVPN